MNAWNFRAPPLKITRRNSGRHGNGFGGRMLNR